MTVPRRLLTLLIVLGTLACSCSAQARNGWRTATPEELASFLPARAPVDKERIESEMRTASGIINERGQMIGSVVLITAGYAAEGKYSHYLLTQRTIKLGDKLTLQPGAYVIGWTRTESGLMVHIFDAPTAKERGVLLAPPIPHTRRVESFRIWPPDEQHYIQIGRFMLPYTIAN